METIKSTHTSILDLPPSCIEFWPLDGRFLVIGTYFLEKNAQDDVPNEPVDHSDGSGQQRSGSLLVFQINDNELREVRTFPTSSAILDLHFNPHDSSLFAVATSTGTLDLYRLIQAAKHEPPSISPVSTLRLAPATTLVLSFTFYYANPSRNLFAATLSTGEVIIGSFQSLSNPIETCIQVVTVLQHPLEAWTCAFAHDGGGIFSGGDDAIFQYTSLPPLNPPNRNNNDTAAIFADLSQLEPTAAWRDKRSHGAGVTAILPLTPTLVLTGSYDDEIRLIDVSARPTVLAADHLGGGVWRLKMLEASSDTEWLILASCMHAGARIVRVNWLDDGMSGIEVLGRFEEHESMNYGSDVQLTKEKEKVIVSTSFYDKRVCLWRWTEKQ